VILFKSISKKWYIICIFVIALYLRTYNLNEFPVGLHGDEASIGYNAYSLLKTARDQNGNFLPLAIDQFGDYRPAGYHYLDIPFVAFFGLNAFAVRLPAALIGSFSVIVFYFLLMELFENEFIAVLGSGLYAILPWSINIDRASSEGIIALFFIMLGTYFYIRTLKRKKFSYTMFILCFVFFIISFFFYHASRYFLPIFSPVLFLIAYVSYHPGKKKIILSGILYGALLISLFFFLSIGKGTGRVSEVSIFNLPGGTGQLKQSMDEEGKQNPLITRFYDNKFFYFGRFFLTFYSEHLTGDFLFVNNGFPIRYKIPFTGNLYLIEAPFLLFGLAVLLYEGIKLKKYPYLLAIAWLFIAPIPVGLTWEDLPNVERASLMIPPLMIITSFGFYQTIFIESKKIKLLVITITSLILVQNFLYFYHNYFWRLKVHEPWYRGAAEPELIYSVMKLSKNYPKIIMTTTNYNNFIFYLFYTKFDPAEFQRLGSPREKDSLKFKNVLYTYDDCPIRGNPEENAKGNENTIFVDKADCKLPKNAFTLQTIYTPDGSPAFKIIKLVQVKTDI